MPTFATPEFKEFFGLGRALRVTLHTGDPEKLLVADKLLQAVLAEDPGGLCRSAFAHFW